MNIALIILIIIILLPLIVGFFLPQRNSYIRTAILKSSPQEIWDVISNMEAQIEWRDDLKAIHMISVKNGEEKWTEIPKGGRSISFQIKTYQPPNRLDIEIIDSAFKGYWEGRIMETATGTKVEFKEIVDIRNPYFRVISYLFVDLGKVMDLYMTNLKKRLGEK